MELCNRCTIDSRVADQYISTSIYSAKELFEDRRAFKATQALHDLSVLRHRYRPPAKYIEPVEEQAQDVKKTKRKKSTE